jgi:HAD superfamily hydrolase (TIGR01509 family)
MPLLALLFDVDGTLADTERDGHRIAFNAAFREFGLDWEWDVSLYGTLLTISGGKERIKHYVDVYDPDFNRPSNLERLIVDLHQAKTRHYTALLAEGRLPMRPGVVRLLAEARAAGLRLGIATTTTLDNVTALLEFGVAPNAESWFDVIAAGDIVSAKKPAPDIYVWAQHKMKVNPESCLAVEDSENGLRASTGAGLKTLVTINDYTADQDFEGAAAVLTDLGEPNAPAKGLSGLWEGDTGYVNVESLRRLHSA